MINELKDGTIVQDGHKVTPRNGANAHHYIPFPVLGQITAIYPLDDNDNADGESVLLDIHVSEYCMDLYKVPHTLEKAGADNYIHYSLAPATKNLDFTPFDKNVLKPQVSDGDTVLVTFAYGNVHQCYVLKVIPHNQSGVNGLCPDPRPTAADGDCFKLRFNGTTFFIDKDGNVSFKTGATLSETLEGNVLGTPKTFTLDFANDAGESTTVILDGSTGNMTYTGSTGTTITFDNENDAIDLLTAFGDEFSVSAKDGIQGSTPASGGTSLSMKNGQVEITGAQGVTVSADSDISVESDGGDVSVKATTGNVSVECDAGDVTLKAAGGAQLNLSKGMVALGNSTAELLDIINTLLTDLATCTAPGFGAPISIVPQIPQLITQLTAIKGSLS